MLLDKASFESPHGSRLTGLSLREVCVLECSCSVILFCCKAEQIGFDSLASVTSGEQILDSNFPGGFCLRKHCPCLAVFWKAEESWFDSGTIESRGEQNLESPKTDSVYPRGFRKRSAVNLGFSWDPHNWQCSWSLGNSAIVVCVDRDSVTLVNVVPIWLGRQSDVSLVLLSNEMPSSIDKHGSDSSFSGSRDFSAWDHLKKGPLVWSSFADHLENLRRLSELN